MSGISFQTVSPSKPQVLPLSTDIFAGIQKNIDHQNYEEAIKDFLFLLIDAKNIPDGKRLYAYLFKLFPHFSGDAFTKNLSYLLEASSNLLEEQKTLSLLLAERARLFAYSQSMSYYASAILIASGQGQEAHPYHILASSLLLNFLKNHRILSFKIQIDRALNGADVQSFNTLLYELSQWSLFCLSESDTAILKGVYGQIRDLINEKNPSLQTLFSKYVPPIIQHLNNPIPYASLPVTQKYHQSLSTFRSLFTTFLKNSPSTSAEIRQFQNISSLQFEQLIDCFLKDIFILLGPPPCGYDIRAMGSCGRKELCPFSDLEPFILIASQDKKCRDYFSLLLQLLDLQIRSLGETADLPLTFTCLGKTNRSGLHLDSGENLSDLIQSPQALAALQAVEHPDNEDPTVSDPNTLAHTALKSRSLQSNDTHLYDAYLKEMDSILNPQLREKRALKYVKKRWVDFAKISFSSSPNLKKEYVEPLNYLMADLSLFFGISATNTLDIIDALAYKNVFNPESAILLKEAVSALYLMRLKLHNHYGEQKEEAYSQPQLGGYVLSSKEQVQLQKIRSLVLDPLYAHLKALFEKTDKAPEITFQEIDLLQIKFKDILSSPDLPASKTAVQLLAAHLAENKAPFSTQESYYRQLSQNGKTDHLRQVYLDVLKSHLPPADIGALALIPNRAGYRLAFADKATQLQTSLFKLTLDHQPPPENNLTAKITTPSCERYLTPAAVTSLLDRSGNIKRSYSGSVHLVSFFGGLHFKQKPVQPLMEYAIHNLFFRIAGSLTPSTQLVRFEVTLSGKTTLYPVLISETLSGATLKAIYKETLNLSPKGWAQWTWLVLCSILTRPGDGLLSNYLVTPHSAYCIDNDISFVEPVTKEGFSQKINFCSALFCLFPDKPLDRDVLKTFCSLDVDTILNGWIEDVITKETEYLNLFTKEELQRFYDEDPNNRFKATILFREGTLATLNLQFSRLQNSLISLLQKQQSPTPLDLLKQLINLRESPTLENGAGTLVYKAYDKARTLPSVDDKLKQITARKQERSMTSMQSDVACLGKVPTWQEIEKLALFTPSKAREELMSTLLKRSADYITTGNIQGKKILRASFKEMSRNNGPDLERQILVLQALTYLISLDDQKPVSITLQHCATLNSKTLEPFLHDKLEYLDLRYCPQLLDKDIETIQAKCPELKELYLSGCSGLKNISVWGLLTSSSLQFPKLQILECNKCENLQTMQIKGMELKRFEANKNPALKKVDLTTFCLREIELKESPLTKLTHDWFAFGKDAWAKYFGDVGIEPPLLSEILSILQSPCPFWSGKKVHETHLLVLIPQTVNGKPLTLKSLGELVQSPKQGPKTKYDYFSDSVLKEHGDTPAEPSHWVLMTRDVIPGSRKKPYADQQKLVTNVSSYQVPKIVEAAICIFMEHARTGARLYGDSPLTYTRCQEKYNKDWQLEVGGFGAAGLYVYLYDDDGGYADYGVGGLRKG